MQVFLIMQVGNNASSDQDLKCCQSVLVSAGWTIHEPNSDVQSEHTNLSIRQLLSHHILCAWTMYFYFEV